MLTTDREPFADLGMLHEYLQGLEAVTAAPTNDDIVVLAGLDTCLTQRTVLYPVRHYERGRSRAVLDYEPRSISGDVIRLARIALDGTGRAPAVTRRTMAQRALVELGRHIPLSGAFELPYVQPALGAVDASLVAIGKTGQNPDFAGFGRYLIERDLYSDWLSVQRGDGSCSPLPHGDVLANITEAWEVVGWPVEVPRPAAA